MFELIPASDIMEILPDDMSALSYRLRLAEGPSLRLIAMGDIGFSGRIGEHGREHGYSEFLADVAPILQMGDIVFGNLETPLLPSIPRGETLFAAEHSAATALQEAGFSHLHLANNHIMDFGAEGLDSTISALKLCNLRPLGAGLTVASRKMELFEETNDIRLGWLACGRTLRSQDSSGPGYCELDPQELLAAVIKNRPVVDILIVSLHAGLMFLDYPDPRHRELAQELVDAGANLVLMHHAHVLQGIEHYGNGVIAYSLGNGLWDWSEGYVASTISLQEQQESALFIFELDKHGVSALCLLPTKMDENLFLRLATSPDDERILERLRRISRDLHTDYELAFRNQRVERNAGHTITVMKYHVRQGNLSLIIRELRRVRPRHLSLFFQWLTRRVTIGHR